MGALLKTAVVGEVLPIGFPIGMDPTCHAEKIVKARQKLQKGETRRRRRRREGSY